MRVLKILPLVASLLAGGWAMAAPPNEETAIAVKWYEAFDKNKPEILEAILADGSRDIPDAPDAPCGAQSAKAVLRMLHTAFPDFQITVEDIISDGNKVVVRSTISGQHLGGNCSSRPSIFTLSKTAGSKRPSTLRIGCPVSPSSVH